MRRLRPRGAASLVHSHWVRGRARVPAGIFRCWVIICTYDQGFLTINLRDWDCVPAFWYKTYNIVVRCSINAINNGGEQIKQALRK